MRPRSASCSGCSVTRDASRHDQTAATTSARAACRSPSASWPTACDIDLDAVPKKYDGLDGTELAISESQERMAVVLAPGDVEAFLALAEEENLEATVVAEVTAEKRLRMLWRGKTICDISREFLNSNGASKHIEIFVGSGEVIGESLSGSFTERLRSALSDKNICSKRGLSERFDSTIGAGTVLMPFGGKYQRTPAQAMAAKIPVQDGETDDCSVFAYGCNPALAAQNPYAGAYTAVVDSLSRLVASGASAADAYLTFQEFFEKPRKEPSRWGKPFAALLGAFDAQLDFGVGAIGGKDSMSGSFEQLDVPPTFVSFAVAMTKASKVISPEFKTCGQLRLPCPSELCRKRLSRRPCRRSAYLRLVEVRHRRRQHPFRPARQ